MNNNFLLIYRHSEFMIAFTAQIETLIERHSNRYKRALTEVSKLDTVYDAGNSIVQLCNRFYC